MTISFMLNYYNNTLSEKLVEKIVYNLCFSKNSAKIHSTDPSTTQIYGRPWQVVHQKYATL